MHGDLGCNGAGKLGVELRSEMLHRILIPQELPGQCLLVMLVSLGVLPQGDGAGTAGADGGPV